MWSGKKLLANKNVKYVLLFFIVILLFVILYSTSLFFNKKNDEKIEEYVYLEPEVEFVENLTCSKGQDVNLLDLVKSAKNCVIIDNDENIDTSSVGTKECTLKIIDDIGVLKEINFTIEIIE